MAAAGAAVVLEELVAVPVVLEVVVDAEAEPVGDPAAGVVALFAPAAVEVD